MTQFFDNKSGRILSGYMKGFDVRIQDDFENTGGYLILFTDPINANSGYDEWIEKEKIGDYFSRENWKIAWNE